MGRSSSCSSLKSDHDDRGSQSDSSQSTAESGDGKLAPVGQGNASLSPRSRSVSDLDSPSSSEDEGPRHPSYILGPSPKGLHLHGPERHSQSSDHENSQSEVPSRAWYELDPVVILALLSPFGNWLTGGDHVKNLAFIALLVYYLHQVIEGPWILYQKARQRRRPPHLPPLSPDDKHRQLVISELRRFELFCLALTAISPFVGVYLLHYATTAILGPDSLSWFSTGLFVMATGIRPWSHLVERLNKHTSDLQDLIHYPRSASHYEHDDDIHEKLELLMKRVDELEDSLSHVKSRLKLTSEDVFDYVDDAIDTVKCSIRKREKRWNEHEGRVRSVEQSIAALASSGSGAASGKKKGRLMMPMITTTAIRSIVSQILPKWLRSPPPGSEGDKDKSRPGSHRGATKPTMRGPATNGRLATIAEENYDWGYPWVMKSSQFMRASHAFASMIFAPLRAVIRMIFGQ